MTRADRGSGNMGIPAPPDSGHRKLRRLAVPAETSWYRIQDTGHPSALHFAKGSDARWNDPRGAYGVLYVADRPETAFAETFGHGLMGGYPPAEDKFVGIEELSERHIHRIRTTRALTLGLLHGPGLPALNLDARLLSTLDYGHPRAWSRWIFEAPDAPDGIRYPSRTLPGQDNTALFDRCRDALTEENLGPLATWRSDTGNLDIWDILDAQGWGLV